MTLFRFLSLLFVAQLAILFSCSSSRDKEVIFSDGSKGGSIELKTNEATPFRWPKKTVIEKTTFLESDRDFIISWIDKLIVSPDGRSMYIVDKRQSKLLVFDRDGLGKSVFHKKGPGPDEYLDISDLQIDFEEQVIEILDYQRIKRYDLNSFAYLGEEDLRKIPKDKNFREFVRTNDKLYLWTNLPPNQRISENEEGSYHLVSIQDNEPMYFVKKEYGVIGHQVFYPSNRKDEYNLNPLVGSSDIIAVNQDSVYVKYRFNFGEKGLPKKELENFFGRAGELLNTDYNKFTSNIRETNTHLFFQFAGNLKANFVLFSKKLHKIQSIGKTVEKLVPTIIYSDQSSFYCFILPGDIMHFLNNGGDLSETTFFKSLPETQVDKYNNPIIVQFRLDEE